MIIRAKTFLRWMHSHFDLSNLQDIARHGADTGWYGLTYTTDCCQLYARFKDEIWDMLLDDAQDFGQSPLEIVASFRGAADVETAQDFETLLARYAAERTAYLLTEE
jgi:hypothetical protein